MKNPFKKKVEERLPPVPAVTHTCCECGVVANNRLYLINTSEKIWDFEGAEMCLECYIKTQVKKAIDYFHNETRANQV